MIGNVNGKVESIYSRKSVIDDAQYIQATSSQVDTIQQSSVLLSDVNQEMDDHTEQIVSLLRKRER